MENIENLKKYTVKDFNSALILCKEIRKETNKRVLIEINESETYGYFKFPYNNFVLKGIGKVIINGNRYSRQLNEEDHLLNTTWRTATLKITGNNNTFINLTIKNTALNPAKKGQQVALGVYGDHNEFYSCKITSTTDTLFIGPLPEDLVKRYIDFIPEDERMIEHNLFTYFNKCFIQGNIDFIFGAGQAYFNNCQIDSVEDMHFKSSFVTAPAHSLIDPFGFLFYKCDFTSKTITSSRVYLSRPWRDFGKTAFINCKYGNHINSKGVINWSNTIRYLTARYLEYPKKEKRAEFLKQLNEIPEIYLNIINKYKN